MLCRGHIFLNTSLTEAFCIGIIEAASCGLVVVSTNVGGIPEVLPSDMIFHSDPDGHALKKKLDHVIGIYDTIDTSNFHQRVQKLFSWKNVAERTEKVYDKVSSSEKLTMLSKLKTGRGLGEYAGWFSIWLELLNFFMALILEFWFEID